MVPQFEDLSMSFTSSGSIENFDVLLQMKADLYAAVDLWFSDLAHGFVPLDKAPDFPAP